LLADEVEVGGGATVLARKGKICLAPHHGALFFDHRLVEIFEIEEYEGRGQGKDHKGNHDCACT